MGQHSKGPSESESMPPASKTLTTVDDLVTDDNDPVIGLRIYGTLTEHKLPTTAWQSLRVGSDASSEIRIGDPSVSRQHAKLVREGSHVMVVDERSKNGTWAGRYGTGSRVALFKMLPGAWVSFGHVLMVAFSKGTDETREQMQRFLGYHPRYASVVDSAVFAARHRRRHVALTMPSAGAPALARLFHKAALGDSWPFVESTERLSEQKSLALLDQARTGTLVVNGRHWPRNPAVLRAAYSQQIPDSRLILVAQRDQTPAAMLGRELEAEFIEVASMEERGAEEIERAINMTAAKYGSPLGMTSDPCTAREWNDFRRRKWVSPESIEFHIRRLVRVVLVGITEAAKLEGVSVPAMSQWADRNVDEERRRP